MSSVEPVLGTVEPTTTPEEVDVLTERLSSPHRPPDYESEHRALAMLASERPGTGSRSTVRLPLPVLPETVPAEAPRQAGASTSRRILLVDDNELLADALSMVLELDGHTVRTVKDGRAALEMMQVFTPDVVLVDVGLPGMSGYEVARRVRESTHQANLVIATLSGYGNEEVCLRSKLAGCDSHLVKPVDLGALRSLLA